MRGSVCIVLTSFARLAVLAGWMISGWPTPVLAQEGSDDEPFLPGLVASFRDSEGHTATRLDHQLAFHWGESPPDPRLAGGEFRATWQGQLLVNKRGDYRFYVFGSDKVELKVAGRVI